MPETVRLSSLTRDISYLRVLGLGDVDLARAGGVVDRLANADIAETVTQGRAAPRIIELAAAAERLEEVLAPEKVVLWLRSSLPVLGWAAPLDLIGSDDYERVAAAIEALEEAAAQE